MDMFKSDKNRFITNQKGSVKNGLTLLLVIVIILVIFWVVDLIDKDKQKVEGINYSNTEDKDEEPAFDDSRMGTAPANDQLMVNPSQEVTEDNVDPSKDPSLQETNSKNAFYKPLSPEKQREKEQKMKKSSSKY